MSVTASDVSAETDSRRADVELRLPADSAYASVLRITTAGLAARLDFTIDDIEDLRMAIGEASAMVLEGAAPGSDLTCRFFLAAGEMTITVSAPTTTGVPDLDSFAWQVLSTLAGSADVKTVEGDLLVSLQMASTVGGASH